MMSWFYLVIIFQYTANFQIIEQRKDVLILPNIGNKLAPFKIVLDKDFDQQNTYSFSAKCNSSFESVFIFTPLGNNICDKTFEFKAAELMAYL